MNMRKDYFSYAKYIILGGSCESKFDRMWTKAIKIELLGDNQYISALTCLCGTLNDAQSRRIAVRTFEFVILLYLEQWPTFLGL